MVRRLGLADFGDIVRCLLKVGIKAAAEEIFGSENENAGKHVGEVARDARIAGAVAEALESQRPVAGEDMSSVLPLAVDGSERAFRLRTTPMHDNWHRLLGAVTILEDITHLREIDQIKSNFIATASDELRTPLTSVLMGVHLLLEGTLGELNDGQNEVLQACRQDCERLDKLMRDLLDLSRIGAGESQPQLALVRARELIASVAEELRPQVETKGLELRVDLSVDRQYLEVDRAQIERVITNLVSNALRHTKHGQIKSAPNNEIATSRSPLATREAAFLRTICRIFSISSCRSRMHLRTERIRTHDLKINCGSPRWAD